MAYCTINGLSVIQGRISLPRNGVWTAELEVDSDQPMSGTVTLNVSGVGLVGSVRKSGVYGGFAKTLVLGGAGGLNKVIPAKGYKGTPAIIPLRDILTAAGETLSATSDSASKNYLLAHWAIHEGTAGSALICLLASLPGGPSWRFLQDGKLWIGPETWPTVEASADVVEEDPTMAHVTVYSGLPAFFPGSKFGGEKVSYVEHRITQEKVRTHLWMELE